MGHRLVMEWAADALFDGRADLTTQMRETHLDDYQDSPLYAKAVLGTCRHTSAPELPHAWTQQRPQHHPAPPSTFIPLCSGMSTRLRRRGARRGVLSLPGMLGLTHAFLSTTAAARLHPARYLCHSAPGTHLRRRGTRGRVLGLPGILGLSRGPFAGAPVPGAQAGGDFAGHEPGSPLLSGVEDVHGLGGMLLAPLPLHAAWPIRCRSMLQE